MPNEVRTVIYAAVPYHSLIWEHLTTHVHRRAMDLPYDDYVILYAYDWTVDSVRALFSKEVLAEMDALGKVQWRQEVNRPTYVKKPVYQTVLEDRWV